MSDWEYRVLILVPDYKYEDDVLDKTLINKKNVPAEDEKYRCLYPKNGYLQLYRLLDLSDNFSELVSLLRRNSNNLTKYAKRANDDGRIYVADIDDIQSSLKSLCEKADQIMTRLSK